MHDEHEMMSDADIERFDDSLQEIRSKASDADVECDDCDGLGLLDDDSECPTCEGEGIIRGSV